MTAHLTHTGLSEVQKLPRQQSCSSRWHAAKNQRAGILPTDVVFYPTVRLIKMLCICWTCGQSDATNARGQTTRWWKLPKRYMYTQRSVFTVYCSGNCRTLERPVKTYASWKRLHPSLTQKLCNSIWHFDDSRLWLKARECTLLHVYSSLDVYRMNIHATKMLRLDKS